MWSHWCACTHRIQYVWILHLIYQSFNPKRDISLERVPLWLFPNSSRVQYSSRKNTFPAESANSTRDTHDTWSGESARKRELSIVWLLIASSSTLDLQDPSSWTGTTRDGWFSYIIHKDGLKRRTSLLNYCSVRYSKSHLSVAWAWQRPKLLTHLSCALTHDETRKPRNTKTWQREALAQSANESVPFCTDFKQSSHLEGVPIGSLEDRNTTLNNLKS